MDQRPGGRVAGSNSPCPPKILVLGATGFIGRALVPALVECGYAVRACARRVGVAGEADKVEYVRCDLLDAATLPPALDGIDAAYYLVHSLRGGAHYRELDKRAALNFAAAAANASLRRIIYLGGVAPCAHASEHLASRLEVGRILRAGRVPTIELRAAMIVGPGSVSWQIVRDLALRLPVMILPLWLSSRLSPIALEDVIHALVDALDVDLEQSAFYDIPGPEVLTCKQILERIAELEGRRLPAISVPWLTPKLSALWLRLVTTASYPLARELVLGLTEDLLPQNRNYWELTHYEPRISFEAAARAALHGEARGGSNRHLGAAEESLVRRLGPRLRAS